MLVRIRLRDETFIQLIVGEASDVYQHAFLLGSTSGIDAKTAYWDELQATFLLQWYNGYNAFDNTSLFFCYVMIVDLAYQGICLLF